MKRVIPALMATIMLLAACALVGCGASPSEKPLPKQPVRVASMKGPTSIGLADMMLQAKEATANAGGDVIANERYEFTVAGSADEIVPKLASGELDIALIPANLAATLYGKTNGGIRAIDVNTLGVLYAVTANPELTSLENASVADLAGRTVYMTGKGTVPEYTFEYLLDCAGLSSDDVNLEFKSEPSEVAALISSDTSAIGILPQPYATSATAKDASLRSIMDLSAQWDALASGANDGAGRMVTGVTVARTEFLEEHPKLVAQFLDDHAVSVKNVLGNPSAYADLLVELGILGNAAVAGKAIPLCNIACITGEEMKTALSGYLQVLHGFSPSSIGGALPPDVFYHLG